MGLKKRKLLTRDLQDHPAVRAWARATSSDAVPDHLYVYRERERRALYLLPGVAPGGGSVFAKRALAPRTVIERSVYSGVLPSLPLTTPCYYGSWLDEPHGWLFVEDVGEERYCEDEPEHLVLAGRWVATLHISAAEVPAARSLPDGGQARYLEHLRTAREKITRSRDRWPYPDKEDELLTAMLSHLDAIESRWNRVEDAWDEAPLTVTHGDFRAKNAYLRRNGGLSLLPIDWETAGWGPPAPDLTRIDLDAYWSVVRDAWPQLDFDTVERWRRMGHLLQKLAAANWVAETLKRESAEDRSYGVKELKAVLKRLAEAGRSARVLDPPPHG